MTSKRYEEGNTSIPNDFKTAIQNLEEHLATDCLTFNQMVKEKNQLHMQV